MAQTLADSNIKTSITTPAKNSLSENFRNNNDEKHREEGAEEQNLVKHDAKALADLLECDTAAVRYVLQDLGVAQRVYFDLSAESLQCRTLIRDDFIGRFKPTYIIKTNEDEIHEQQFNVTRSEVIAALKFLPCSDAAGDLQAGVNIKRSREIIKNITNNINKFPGGITLILCLDSQATINYTAAQLQFELSLLLEQPRLIYRRSTVKDIATHLLKEYFRAFSYLVDNQQQRLRYFMADFLLITSRFQKKYSSIDNYWIDSFSNFILAMSQLIRDDAVGSDQEVDKFTECWLILDQFVSRFPADSLEIPIIMFLKKCIEKRYSSEDWDKKKALLNHNKFFQETILEKLSGTAIACMLLFDFMKFDYGDKKRASLINTMFIINNCNKIDYKFLSVIGTAAVDFRHYDSYSFKSIHRVFLAFLLGKYVEPEDRLCILSFIEVPNFFDKSEEYEGFIIQAITTYPSQAIATQKIKKAAEKFQIPQDYFASYSSAGSGTPEPSAPPEDGSTSLQEEAKAEGSCAGEDTTCCSFCLEALKVPDKTVGKLLKELQDIRAEVAKCANATQHFLLAGLPVPANEGKPADNKGIAKQVEGHNREEGQSDVWSILTAVLSNQQTFLVNQQQILAELANLNKRLTVLEQQLPQAKEQKRSRAEHSIPGHLQESPAFFSAGGVAFVGENVGVEGLEHSDTESSDEELDSSAELK